MSNTTDNKPQKMRVPVSFAALDPWLESHIVSPKETVLKGKDLVEWGDHNAYPDYLLDLSKTVTTLGTIIGGTTDFVAGDDASITPLHEGLPANAMNYKGDLITEQVEDLARNVLTYGGFALQVIRGRDGSVAEVYFVDMRFLRMNKEGNVFYYSEKWGRTGTKDAVVYPVFRPDVKEKWFSLEDEERNRHASSILLVKTDRTQVYPSPVWAASVKACEIERLVDDYHLNSISNGFASSLIVNFNNGVPTDQVKDEIEADFSEKFTGTGNAGRVMFSWNRDKGSATTVETPEITDFGEKYKALAENSTKKIFTAFRAIPLLFGLTAGISTGFSTDEFEQSFKLYNRTVVRPIQKMICDAYDKIYGMKGVLKITPFSLEGTAESTVN